MPDYTFAALRASGAVPHRFGLNVVQLRLNPRQRLQFWHPSLRADVAEDIHNHYWSYCARVLVGDLVHETWRYGAGEGNDAECLEAGGLGHPCRALSSGSLALSGRYSMPAGSSYFFPASGFHRVLARRAVALLCRGETETHQALVVRPREAAGSPGESRERSACCAACAVHPSSDECWDIIADLLGR